MENLLGVLAVAIQLSNSYLRYLPFSGKITDEEITKLRRGFLICAVASCICYSFLFLRYGITAPLYKNILIFGNFQWVIISVWAIRRSIFQHIFVFGMAGIWTLIVHNFDAIIIVAIFETEREIIFANSVLYLILFAVSLPLAKKFFVKLLPPEKFFEDYGNFVAFLPFIMTVGVILLWAQEPLIHTWQERFSRFYLPFAFLMFYQHIYKTTEQIQERRRTAQSLRLMKEQINALSEYNLLIQENNEKVLVMRHDLRHTFRLLYMMIQEKKFDDAKEYLRKEEKSLGETAVKNFCKQPLINAALSLYIQRAKKSGIKINHRINLPVKISTDENDFALLICNLLENALNAASKQSQDKKQISVIVQNLDGQFVLEISNFCNEQVIFDEKNFPYTSQEGHGLGMASVKIFQEKYNAYVDFSQVDDVFKVTMYWQD